LEAPLQSPADEIKRLQHCINDLVSALALPAIWAGGEPSQVVSTLLDVLLGMLRLDFVYARLNGPLGEAPLEMFRAAPSRSLSAEPEEIGGLLNQWLGDDPTRWTATARKRFGDAEISLLPLRMGLQGEIGVIVAGSQRADFPVQTERLVLSVAANQAAIGLRESRLLREQRRVANELDRRVAERTKELTKANEELRLQAGLLQHLPVSAWTLKPDGTPDFVNQVWLAYSGQTLDFIRSHPEAWMTAVHPEDRETASKAFWDGVRSGQGFAMETRSLRARDGTYRWHLNRAVVLRDAEGKVLKFVGTTTDIDDQKRAEEELRASEANLRQIFDNIPGLIGIWSPDGELESVNRQLLEYFGKTFEELKDWIAAGVVHPDDLPRVISVFGSSITTGDPFDLELRYRRADGVHRWFQVRGLPIRDAGGRIMRWHALLIDIEDRRRVEDELRRSEARKSAILDSALDCIVTIDHEGRITEFNPAAERTFGYRRDDVLGRRLADVIIPPSLRKQHRQGFARYLATGEARVLGKRLEMTAIRADGSEFPVELSISRIPVDGPPSFTGYLRDITERRRAEEELRRSEAFLAEGQRLNLTGSFSWRLDTDEIAFSEQLYRIFEFGRDAPVTIERIAGRVHPDDFPLLAEKIERARAGTSSELYYEIRLRMEDDSIKHLRTNAHVARDQNGRPEIIGAIQDVTERRLSEEALGKVRSELAHMARVTSLGALTASIAHEVNQPLSGIVTNASTCLRMLAADPPNVEGARETARRTIRDGNRASEVITRLRALFSKKETTTELVDLNEAAREVVALSLSELQRNRVVVRSELAEGLPLVVGDRVQLQQVILNLLLNASDAMEGIEDRPRQLVIRTEREDGNRVNVAVQDAGVGIDPRSAERIFEAFYTTKSAGMGMGLSVSRSIIENHCGRLWAAPNDGPGTTISFSIPCAPMGATDAQGPGSIQASASMETQNVARNPQ
jgi:PAS domain S-box-containing protein